MDTVSYKIKIASIQSIFKHLENCKDNFVPVLEDRVNIREYAEKLFIKSVTFEAWQNDLLAGLVACYFNDPDRKTGFITSVSVEEKYSGSGIAKELMKMCIDYAVKNKYKEILLDVGSNNSRAINLYDKLGFIIIDNDNEFLRMKLEI
jgi:ribosomal protein S18 acetylase RimI-like enzyme